MLLQALFLILWWLTVCMCDVRFAFWYILPLYGSNHGKVLNENENLEGRKENFKKKNLNDKPLKRLPFIQTPLSAWGHWEQGNHGSLRSSSDLREPTQFSHRPGNCTWGKSAGEVYSRKGQVVQLSETCLLLDLFSVGGDGEVKLWVWLPAPREPRSSWLTPGWRLWAPMGRDQLCSVFVLHLAQ